jgi:hypothetical protein
MLSLYRQALIRQHEQIALPVDPLEWQCDPAARPHHREFREIVLKFAISNIEQLCEPL